MATRAARAVIRWGFAASTIAAIKLDPFPLLFVTTVLILGVVFPAVWSRKHFRRKAACEVLGQLLGSGSRRRPSA